MKFRVGQVLNSRLHRTSHVMLLVLDVHEPTVVQGPTITVLGLTDASAWRAGQTLEVTEKTLDEYFVEFPL